MMHPACLYLTKAVCRGSRFVLGVFLVAFVLTGCGGEARSIPGRISREPHAPGNDQPGLHGEVLARPLRVLVESEQIPGLLGGKGTRSPIRGATVTFTIDNPGSGAVFPENGATTIAVETGSDGIAATRLRLGQRSTDVGVTATAEFPGESRSVSFRAVAGVEFIGTDLEATTGGEISEFGVRLVEPSGEPAVGILVYFTAVDSSVGKARVITDEEGRAVTSWKLGESMKQYTAMVEIDDHRPGVPESERFAVRMLEFRAVALSRRQMAVTLFGGLAVFIFGMKLMSGGLQRMADRRLRAVLQAVTRNTVSAVGVGAGLTAMIQSSSATTVMTVGFVNAGLLTLYQSIGVIYGANIGTTITAQMIAFKLTALAYPAIVVGLLFSFLRRPTFKYFGEATLGFGLLFLGMMTMSNIFKPLRHSPAFLEWFGMFDCSPVNGFVPWDAALMCIVVGAVITVMVQSSSASIGLILAMCGQGLLPFYSAFPLMLGTNIGTTITAILASLGANRNAKRVALAHTLFNVFGSLYLYLLLFVPLWNGQPLFLGFIDTITPGEVFAASSENLPRHVANAHTAFNVLNCLLFMPFVAVMLKIVQKIIPVTDADRETVLEYLEPHLLNTPSLAVQLAVEEVTYMLRRAQKSINDGCDLFCGGPRDLERKILEREDLIDRLQHEITDYLVDLAQRDLSPSESAQIPTLIHAVNDAERIGDRSENLVELTHLKRDSNRTITEFAEKDIRELQQRVNEQCHTIYQILQNEGAVPVEEAVKEAVDREKEISELMIRASDDHVKRLRAGECDVQAGVIFLDVMGNLERVGDHLLNIAERLAEVTTR